MCEHCDALQARCDELVKWLEKMQLVQAPDEDAELIHFISHKMGNDLTGGITALTTQDVMHFGCSCYGLGLRRGYEIRTLEAQSNAR